jgi:hypothetical protein
MKQELREADYKIATVKWLYEKGYLQNDAVLINELPVDNFNRRADLVVANGKLHAFEIKSDVDSLVRLEGQINSYLSFFDKVTVVCSSKHANKAKETLPQNVEILELSMNKHGEVKLKIKRRGQTKNIEDPKCFLSFVEKKNIVSSLKKRGIACTIGESRESLYEKTLYTPRAFWRDLVLNYLKDKYKTTSECFLSSLDSKSNLELLSSLRLNSTSRKNMNDIIKSKDNDDAWIKSSVLNQHVNNGLDISERMYKFGLVAKEPIMVIPRARGG